MSLRVHALECRHPGAAAATLRDVSFTVEPGRLAAVLGPSGAGKTTLLRCLAGLDPIVRGVIEVDDVRVAVDDAGGPRAAAAARARLRGRIGLVFQSLELFPHLTILENCVLAPMRVQGRSRADAEERARTLLTGLGLGAEAHAHPLRLSGGQCQRAAIARALAMEPRVLLYDEPTSALDAALREEVRETLGRVRAAGVTQVVVTHDAELAHRAADQVFTLREGTLHAEIRA